MSLASLHCFRATRERRGQEARKGRRGKVGDYMVANQAFSNYPLREDVFVDCVSAASLLSRCSGRSARGGERAEGKEEGQRSEDGSG